MLSHRINVYSISSCWYLLSEMLCPFITVISGSTSQSLQLCCIGMIAVDDNAFEGLDSLRVLRLHSNNLTAGPSLQHIPHVRLLSLQNNFIANLSRRYFAGCVDLTGLYLEHNYLASLPDMTHVARSLQFVTLHGNRLVYLEAFERTAWPQLRRLTLAHNLITGLKSSLLENTQALEFIDLAHNELRTLPDFTQIKMFQNTSHMLTIRVEGNLWHCNGSLQWVLGGTRDRTYLKFDVGFLMEDVTHMLCHIPSKLNHTPLWDLGKFLFCPVVTEHSQCCDNEKILDKTTYIRKKRNIFDIDGLVQDCSNSIANALELLQSCIKPSIYGTEPWVSQLGPYLTHQCTPSPKHSGKCNRQAWPCLSWSRFPVYGNDKEHAVMF